MRTLLLSLCLFVPLMAQPPEGTPPQGAPPAGGARRPMPEPKNLKVLKVPTSELIPIMRNFSQSLGVQCTFCHVQGNFAADDKHEKDIARMMITMTEHINSNFPNGTAHVGCFTCHRGDKEPVMNPPAAAPGAERRPPPPPQQN
jgi:hypothetical protein